MEHELQNILNSSASSINVLIAYGTLGFGLKAKEFCERLTQNLPPDCKLRLDFWSLFTLRLHILAFEEEVAKTDVLIMAVHGDEDLPGNVLSWVRRWARRKPAGSGVLAAQFHGLHKMNQEWSPAYESLRRLAQESGVDFLSQFIEPASDPLDNSTVWSAFSGQSCVTTETNERRCST